MHNGRRTSPIRVWAAKGTHWGVWRPYDWPACVCVRGAVALVWGAPSGGWHTVTVQHWHTPATRYRQPGAGTLAGGCPHLRRHLAPQVVHRRVRHALHPNLAREGDRRELPGVDARLVQVPDVELHRRVVLGRDELGGPRAATGKGSACGHQRLRLPRRGAAERATAARARYGARGTSGLPGAGQRRRFAARRPAPTHPSSP